MEGGVDRLEEHRDAGAQPDPQDQPDHDDHDAVGREGLRGRECGLEDPELLALLAPLHVGRDTGLEPLVAELLVAREEVLVLALQRGELLGHPRSRRPDSRRSGRSGRSAARCPGARRSARRLGALLLARWRSAGRERDPSPLRPRAAAFSIFAFTSAISCWVATMSGCFSVKPRPLYSASCSSRSSSLRPGVIWLGWSLSAAPPASICCL